jgi:ribosomal protein S17E
MQRKTDWTVSTWGIEEPSRPAVAKDLRAGVPAVHFRNQRTKWQVTIVFERTGELREVRFSGPGLSVEGLRHVRVGELAEIATKHVRDWVTAYAASRPVRVREAEAEERYWADKAKGAGIAWPQPSSWVLEDMVEGFRRPSKVGGPRVSDLELALAARDYVVRCVEGGERVAHVAKSRAQGQSTFSDWLGMARERGLLSGRPGRGQIAGALTAKAKRILRQAEQSAQEVG